MPQGIILVVDDDQHVRTLIRSILQSCADRILEAGNGFEALKLVNNLGSNIDLMLTDIAMPGMDGVALARSVKDSFPSIAVILMSGSPEGDWPGPIPDRCQVIRKPFGTEFLLKAVRSALPHPEDTGSGPSSSRVA
jgi:CheY-like chemotaxis protein